MNALGRWESLHKIALLGTERAGEMLEIGADAPEPLRAALSHDREGALLSLVAAASLQRRAGALVPAPSDTTAQASTCADESQPYAPAPASARGRALAQAGDSALLREWLALAGQAQVLAPPDALPALLRMGARATVVRPFILPVLGERGRWLAAQNPEWSWVEKSHSAPKEKRPATDGASEWEKALAAFRDGVGNARTKAFRALRAEDAAQARQVLADSWKDEGQSARTQFVEEMRPDLSPHDEEFLEFALGDSALSVRKAAAQVLVALPDSAFAARAFDRARPFLRCERNAEGLKIEADLPPVWDTAWERDGIERGGLRGAANPQATGQRAWWLVQMLSLVPPQMWAQMWSTTPIEILRAVARDEPVLLEGLGLAAVRAQDQTWLRALLISPAAMQGIPGVPHNFLLGQLHAPDRDALLCEMVREVQNSAVESEATAVRGLLQSHGEPWGAALSHAVADWSRAVAHRAAAAENPKKLNAWQFPGGQLLQGAAHFAGLMHLDALAQAAQGWPETEVPRWVHDARDAFDDAFETRRDLRREFGL